MRLADHGVKKGTGSLVLLKTQGALAPQMTPTTLTPSPADGVVRSGDVIQLQSICNGGVLGASTGQKLRSLEDILSPVYCSIKSNAPIARNTMTISAWDGAEGPICYGQKLALTFATQQSGK